VLQSQVVAVVSELAAGESGVFRGRDAEARGVERKQIAALVDAGIAVRVLPNTYRLASVAPTSAQRLRAALLWAGDDAAAACRSAGEWMCLEGVRAPKPEIVVPRGRTRRSDQVVVSAASDPGSLMIRTVRGLRVTGVEATLVRLAHVLDDEALEVAYEDARRRQLTSIPVMKAYLARHARAGQRGLASIGSVTAQLDPAHPSRSTLEVKTRRLLTANGLTDFVREHPLAWGGRPYLFDFAFLARRTILETNGRRWHDDTNDYEFDHEKWSVPGRHGFRLVLATWQKVTKRPEALLDELTATLAA
jgi:very-short-patch-repair endonuclease